MRDTVSCGDLKDTPSADVTLEQPVRDLETLLSLELGY